MYTFSAAQIELMKNLGVNVRWHSRAVSYRDNRIEGGNPVIETSKPPGLFCEVLDLAVGGGPFVVAPGNTKEESLNKALELAKTAERPLSASQKYMRDLEKSRQAAKDAEIAALKAQIEAMGGTPVPAVKPVPVVPLPPSPKPDELPPSPSIRRNTLNTGGIIKTKKA